MIDFLSDLVESGGLAFYFWFVLPVSFIAGLTATLLCRKIAISLGVVDKPDGLVKTHTEPVAYLGGVGIFAGFVVGVLATVIFLPSYALKWLMGIVIAGTIACVVGLVDDVSDIKPWQKIVGQVAAGIAILVCGTGAGLGYFAELSGYQIPPMLQIVPGFVIVMVFVLGATNSLNLLDGIDGLCAGVAAVIACGMLALAMILEAQSGAHFSHSVRIIVGLSLLGSVCGFLPFNKAPARIFMGDAGSLFLGVVIAAMMMTFAAAGIQWCLCSIIIFGLPILDTAVAFARRWINKKPFFVSDRGHIYDQMMDRGMPLKKTVGTCCCLAGVYSLIGLVMSQMEMVYALAVCLAVFVVSGFVVWKKGFLKMDGLRGAVNNKD